MSALVATEEKRREKKRKKGGDEEGEQGELSLDDEGDERDGEDAA